MLVGVQFNVLRLGRQLVPEIRSDIIMGMISIRILASVLAFEGFLQRAFADVGPGGSVSVTIINPLRCGDFQCVADAVARGLMLMAIPIVSIMVLWGGFNILTAGGNPEKLATGKKTVLYAVIGFAIVLVAQGVRFIVVELLAPA